MQMKNILLVDDHAVMRRGLNELLKELYPHVVISEAGDVDAMLNHFRHNKVDLLVMDVQMPDTNTVSMVELVSIKYPFTCILIYSMMPANIYSKRLIRAGASVYLQKDSPICEVKETFNLVMNSQQAGMNSPARNAAEDTASAIDPFASLSHREFEVLNLLLKGDSLNDVAANLNLKPSTVGTYKARIFQKLHIRNIFELKDLTWLYNFDHRNYRSRGSLDETGSENQVTLQ